MNEMGKPEKPPRAGRTSFIYGMIFLSFASLIARMGYLQITKGEYYRVQAANFQYVKVPVLPVRGKIYDANNNLLAYDAPVYSLYLTRTSMMNYNTYAQLADKLAGVLGISRGKLLSTMTGDTAYASVRLATKLTEKQLSYIQEHKSVLPGVEVVAESQRVYPFGDLAGQVLGYTGKITKEDEAKYKQLGYINTQIVGRAGLELEYEHQLQGSVGYEFTTVNQTDGSVTSLGFSPQPKPGDNLRLTIDGRLQAETQNEIINMINQSKYKDEIDDASAVAIDVKTGGVLAMVSYPYVDPNWFADGVSAAKHATYLSTTSAQMNHAIQSPMYPGSTVKPANLITGLQLGAISPSTVIQDHMITRVGQATLSDDGMSHGWVDPIKAIGVSCDTFFYELGLNMGKWFGGVSNYQHWLNTSFAQGITNLFKGEWDFGLGQITGIDLPYEEQGIFYVEDSRQQMARVPFHLQQAEDALKKTGQYPMYGSPVDLAFAGIGQSQQFTPIQLAQYVATIANNGKRLKPHVVQEIIPQDGSKPTVIQPVVENVVKANPEYFKIAQEGMYAALYSPGGTAYGVFNNDPYKAAGKTGTAEITVHGKKVDNSVFIAYAPYDNPQIAVAVMVPGAGYGAESAAPVAEKMFNTYFQERHEFFPKNQWLDTKVPADWTKSPAYTIPESKK
jgi:penicillin-binding protein 2